MRQREEEEIVQTIVDALTYRGYIAQKVNQRRADQSGSDVVPDLFVTHKRWPEGVWAGGEVKTPTGRLSKRRPSHRGYSGYSQQDLFDMGRLFVWRNHEEALADLVRFEARLNMQMRKEKENGAGS